MDVIDELITHCEAWEPWARVMGNVCAGDAAQALRNLRAELAECKRDAERYRWIRGNVPSHSTRWSRWKVEYFYGASGWNDLRHAKLDAEIDAALAAKE